MSGETVRVKRALVSVFDKTGLADFAKSLSVFGNVVAMRPNSLKITDKVATVEHSGNYVAHFLQDLGSVHSFGLMNVFRGRNPDSSSTQDPSEGEKPSEA